MVDYPNGREGGYGGTPLAHLICFLFVSYAAVSPHKLVSHMDHSFLRSTFLHKSLQANQNQSFDSSSSVQDFDKMNF